jgi:hypothetical protein
MMAYCKTCHIHYDTSQTHCVICQKPLDGNVSYHHHYPTFEKKPKFFQFLKLLFYLVVIGSLSSIYLDIQTPPLSWSLIVIVSSIYTLIIVSSLFQLEWWSVKVTKIILITMVALLSLGIVLRDISWMIDFVFPITINVNQLLLLIALIGKQPNKLDTIFYLFILSIMGLLPGLFNLLHITIITIPSIISFLVSLSLLLFLLVFMKASLKLSLSRHLHI